ncbi:hypothetical protein E2C01_016149 [Portunus trituberculatus]|uniref:Uncharacterized protein n=1 Tax=Portunus trituberculatus TaxID=210409 RepID=A0A5B7DNA9_PORTR|nr:hypothetical protein [Portunus trituberculatus]
MVLLAWLDNERDPVPRGKGCRERVLCMFCRSQEGTEEESSLTVHDALLYTFFGQTNDQTQDDSIFPCVANGHDSHLTEQIGYCYLHGPKQK